MKKTYLQPATEILELNAVEMLALSLQNGGEKADPTGEVLTKEDNAWDIWSNDMVEEEY